MSPHRTPGEREADPPAPRTPIRWALIGQRIMIGGGCALGALLVSGVILFTDPQGGGYAFRWTCVAALWIFASGATIFFGTEAGKS